MKREESKMFRRMGWREHIGLPDLGVEVIKAKIDTGARTSALHVEDVEPFEEGGASFVRFRVPIPDKKIHTKCVSALIGVRPIKNTSGQPENRYVIPTTLIVGGWHWKIELSLANRSEMGFPIILGRTAIRRHRLLVDPGASFLCGQPQPLHHAVEANEKQRSAQKRLASRVRISPIAVNTEKIE